MGRSGDGKRNNLLGWPYSQLDSKLEAARRTSGTQGIDVQKETQKEHSYTVDGLINGGRGGAYIREGHISGIIYSLANG